MILFVGSIFCAPVSLVIMVRKGWSVMDVPSDGWVKVLRGRRPPFSAVASGTEEFFKGGVAQFRWWWAMEEDTRVGLFYGHERCAQFPSSPQSSGPGGESCSRGTRGIVITCHGGGAEAQCATANFLETRFRAKLERVMELLQGTTGEEVDAIKIVLGFVERAQKRLVKLAERDAEYALLEEGRARLARLEAQAAVRVVAPPPPAPTAVSDLEAEGGDVCWASFRSCQGLPLVDEGCTGVATVDSTTVVDAFCCSQFCEVMRQQVRRSFRTTLRWFQVILQYGPRGVRVGEASNPGPQTRRSTRL